MHDLIIDSEFRDLLPPLPEDKRKQLEENVLRDGIREPLTIWQGILVDGHNRYEIAQKHGLDFKTVEKDFASRNDAMYWMVMNQFGRRDLTAYDRSVLALKLKPIIAAKAKEKQAEYHGNQYQSAVPQIFAEVQTTTPQEQKKNENDRETNAQIAEKAGVSRETIRKVEKIEAQATPEIKAALRSGDLSINAAYNKVQQAKRKADIQQQVEEIEQQAAEQPEGLFDVIAIDPPWGYVKEAHHGSFDADGRRCTNPYPEMTQAELKAIELPAADNCVLFLWTTHKFIWDAKELLDHWGFNYRCMLVWNKQMLGTGNLIRMQCEFCLVGLKGKPVFKDVHNVRDLIEEMRREHSRKPEAFYQLVEELCAGRKLDYFSRQQREGWSTYGNDTNKFKVA